MRKFGQVAVAALAMTLFASAAEARRGGAVWMDSQQLHFVANTTVSNGTGGTLALCHMSTKSHIFQVGLWRTMESYALSFNGCKGDSYTPVTASRMERMLADGDVPAGLPVAPKMTRAEAISGFSGLALAGAVIAILGLFKLLKLMGRSRRQSAIRGATGFGKRVLDVMCHAAKADGHVDPEEVSLIAFASQRLTGSAYPAEQIEKLIGMAGSRLSDDDFRAFGTGLNARQRETLMRGALMVTISDGQISQSEKGFLARLAASLKISGPEMQGMLRSL